MTGIHARPGQSRDRLDTWTRQFAAWLGDARAWLRQLVLNAAAWRASRKARAAGLDAIAARELAAMRPDPDRPAGYWPACLPAPATPDPMLPAAGPPARQPEAAPSPPARLAPSPAPPGEGAVPRLPWVITQPKPGSPLGWVPVTLRRPDGAVTISESGHVAVVPGNWRETRPNPVLEDPPVVPRWYLAWLAQHPEAEIRDGTA